MKKKLPLGQRLVQAAKEARDFARGDLDPSTYVVHTPPQVDVKAIRRGLGMSQERFAASFGLAKATVRGWEQGRRHMRGAERALLTIISREPEAARRALEEEQRAMEEEQRAQT